MATDMRSGWDHQVSTGVPALGTFPYNFQKCFAMQKHVQDTVCIYVETCLGSFRTVLCVYIEADTPFNCPKSCCIVNTWRRLATFNYTVEAMAINCRCEAQVPPGHQQHQQSRTQNANCTDLYNFSCVTCIIYIIYHLSSLLYKQILYAIYPG